MKTIIAGCRNFEDLAAFQSMIVDCPFTITEVVSGAAKGVDLLGEKWAEIRQLPLHRFPADWDTHGRAAGPIRNRKMAENAEALFAVWDGVSRGTKNMIREARAKGLRVHIANIP